MRARAMATALAVLGLLVAACGSGSGPLVTTSGSGDQGAGSTRDQPTGGRDDPNGDCMSCDVTYSCPGYAGGDTISLSSASGVCTQTIINIVCSGALFGTPKCCGGGGGAFTCGNITCTPQQSQQQTPGGSNGVDAG
jgi:hypothetical protein